MRIKKINPLSLGYNLALIYLIFGILFSAFMLILRNNPNLIGVINPATLSLTNTQVFLLYPLGYAIGGFITGIVIGFIYNHIVKITGGISIELSKEEPNIKRDHNKDRKEEHDDKPKLDNESKLKED
jgi:hypothetical protein